MFFNMVYLPVKIDVEDIKAGEIRLEKIDGTVVAIKDFKASSDFLETELQLQEKISNPFIYRVVIEGDGKKVVRSLIKVSYFPEVMLDVQSTLQSGVKNPLGITLSPLSFPFITPFDYAVELVDPEGNILWRKEGVIKKEELGAELTVKPPSVNKGVSGLITLKISNSFFSSEIGKKVFIVPKKMKVFLITDKPIYQPSQTVHIRTLSLYAFDKKSVRGKEFVFKIIDPSSNIVMQRKVKTDKFGVGYLSFQLADQVITGTYRIEIYNKGEKVAEKTFQVKRYVLPKFNVILKTDKEFYLPSETVKGEIQARYFFGKPVNRAKVKVKFKKFEIYTEEMGDIQGKTDKKGIFKFQFSLPEYFAGMDFDKGTAPIFIDVEVKDATGHIEEKSFDKKVVINPLDIEMIPAGGYLIKGVENKVIVSVSNPDGTPAKGRLHISEGDFSKDIDVSKTGFSYFFIKPESENLTIKAEFSDNGLNFKKKFYFNIKSPEKDKIILYLKDIRGKVGENFPVKILSFQNIKVAYLDIVKQSQTYLKKTVRLEKGEGEFNFAVDNLLSGTCVISAYAITSRGNIIRDSKVVYFAPADELEITTKHKASYRPGENGEIVFSIKDKKGKPKISVFGVSIVDSAVFALSELHPGLEKVFFQIEQELLNPKYEIHGLKWGYAIEKRRKDAMEMLLSFVSKEVTTDFEKPVSCFNHTEIRNLVMQVLQKPLLDKLYKVQTRHSSTLINLHIKDLTNFFVRKGFIKKEELIDPWGTPVKIKKGFRSNLIVVSAGPDEKFGTKDDIEIPVYDEIYLCMTKENRFLEGVNTGMVPIDSNTVPSGNNGEESAHVRKYFPETFVFEPALITDRNGRAKLKVTMPDAITTYKMSVFASTPDGLLGSAEDSIKIFKKFFIEPDLPLNFVRGDRVSLRLGVYNYTSEKLNVSIEIEGDDKVKIKEKKFGIKIKPQSVESVYVPIEFVKSGEARLRITGTSSGEKDIVEKTVTVIPPGIKREVSISGELTKEKTFHVSYPEESDPEQRKTYLRIYPGALSQVLTGLESLLGMPHGCFEQTSSATYPNVLILNYLRQKNVDLPEIDMKATNYINLGYQRLLTFEVKTGGFSWFGSPPANQILTAYGLREFTDMKKVFPIDENIINRTLKWLLKQQKRDGSFLPDKYSINEEVTVGMGKNKLLPTSYIAWTLNEIGYDGEELEKARNYLKNHIKDVKTNYERALFLNALIGDEKAFDKIWQQLKKKMLEDDSGVYWESKEKGGSWIFGKGITKSIETTALIANALINAEIEPDVVRKIVNYLYEKRTPSGGWYTTQATIIALKVITLYSMKSENIEGKLIVNVGKEVKEIKLDKNSGEMQIINIPEGVSEIKVNFKGKGSPVYDFVSSFYMKDYPVEKAETLRINLKYDKQNLKMNDLVKVSLEVKSLPETVAEMVVVDLGIPSGFSPLPAEWEELVKDGIIKRYEFTGKQIIAYFDRITSEPVKFEYHLRADYPLKISGAGARIYEYYNPDNEGYVSPVSIEVKK